MPLLIVLLIVLGIVAGVVVAIFSHRMTLARWSAAADRLGLDLTGTGMFSFPRLSGLIDGYPVSVHAFSSGTNNNQKRYTRYQINYPPLGLGFELSRQTKVGGFFRRIVGMQDIETGHNEFDDAFIVNATSPDQLTAFLTGVRRLALTRLLASYPTLKVADTYIRVDVRRIERDLDAFVSTVRRLVGTARTITGLSDDADLNAAVSSREAGDLSEAARRMRAAVESFPDDLDRRLLELETLAATEEVEGLEPRMVELEQLAPTDPDVVGWRESLASPVEKATESANERVPTIDAATATQDLFGGRQLSFAVRDKFIANYAGATIRWAGTIKSARSYDVDHDFGSGPGIKAVVTVSELHHDLFGSTEVDAIVELPESPNVPERGTTITFSGTLTAVDPLMRNFTIREAKLA